MAPIGVAIIGGGIFAKEQHLPAVLATPNISLKAIFSRSLKSAQDLAGLIEDESIPKPDLYSADLTDAGKGFPDLLKRDDIAAVIIALPIMVQPEFIQAALAAGKHVLSEKPIAPNVNTALKLLMDYQYAHDADGHATWSVAENFRFLPAFAYAAEQIKALGKVQSFSSRIFFLVKPGTKYIETEWRKQPSHAGGFLLDGGVHFTAATRLLLGPDNAPESVVAFSNQVQPYLPPVDTLHAIVKTKSQVVGSFLCSVGTNMDCHDYTVTCEKGCVTATSTKVTVVRTSDGGEKSEPEVKEFEFSSGVKREVQTWAESLSSGIPNPFQSPEQALADLEFLLMMVRSGEEHGSLQPLSYQSGDGVGSA